jgi:hypothetical protein
MPAPEIPPAGKVGLVALGMMLMGVVWSGGKRKRRWVLTMAAMLAVGVSLSACNNLPQGPNGATPAGTYVLTVTATVAGQAPQAVQINVNVN